MADPYLTNDNATILEPCSTVSFSINKGKLSKFRSTYTSTLPKYIALLMPFLLGSINLPTSLVSAEVVSSENSGPVLGVGSTLPDQAVAGKPISLPERFHIVPPSIPRVPLTPNRQDLPQEIRVWFPEYDGDGFFASLVPKRVASEREFGSDSVFQTAVKPILLKFGFKSDILSQFPLPQHNGIPSVRANLSGLARQMCNESSHGQRANVLPPPVSGLSNSESFHLVHNPLPISASQDIALQGTDLEDREVFEGWLKSWTNWWCRVIEEVGNKDTLALLEKEYPSFLDMFNLAFRDQIGLTLPQYVENFQRQEYLYVFPQVHHPQQDSFTADLTAPNAVTIDHTGVRATRREGETVYSITGRVLQSYAVTNKVSRSKANAAFRAISELKKLSGVTKVEEIPEEWVSLVLLPTGGVERNTLLIPALRYAYRMPAYVGGDGTRGLVYLWLDADEGRILELDSLFGGAGAGGQATAIAQTLHHDPGYPPPPADLQQIGIGLFRLDPPNNLIPGNLSGAFNLTVDGVLRGVGNSLQINHVVPSADADWDFTGLPIPTKDELNRFVDPPESGSTWQRIDLFATAYRHVDIIANSPITQAFPPPGFPVTLQFGAWSCVQKELSGYEGGTYTLIQKALPSPYPNSCLLPPLTPPTNAHKTYVDHTLLAHEMGHMITTHQYGYGPPEAPTRSTGWCGMAPGFVCPLPVMPIYMHDLADAWVQVFEFTNCVGGWMGQSIKLGIQDSFGADSLYCQKHHEGSGWPRLSSVPDPVQFNYTLNPLSVNADTWHENFARQVGDHFPEHRKITQLSDGRDYADMQIAAAALWDIRQGARSLSPAGGSLDYLVRFVRAVATTGWLGSLALDPLGNACTDGRPPETTDCPRFPNGYTDRDVYRGLLDLEIKLAGQWTTQDSIGTTIIAPSINKVAAGFARAGVFMIQSVCLDGNPSNNALCPDNDDSGADAVIDVTDNACSDDWIIDGSGAPCDPAPIPGVLFQERDYLKPGIPLPGFHVWTGPRYVFSGNDANITSSPLCNNMFKVQVAEDEAFTTILATSGWLETSQPCYHNWVLTNIQWQNITDKLDADQKNRIYYRAITCTVAPGNGTPCVFPFHTGRHERDVDLPTIRGALLSTIEIDHPSASHVRYSTTPAYGLFGQVPPPYAIVNKWGTYPHPFRDAEITDRNEIFEVMARLNLPRPPEELPPLRRSPHVH